jgi:hypothetical protein
VLDPHTRGAGPEIVSFEFAGSRERALQITAEWGSYGRHLARLGLWLDFGYMLSYGTFFALAGFAVRDTALRRGWRRIAAAGRVLPYCAIAAACFDAVEDVALLLVLGGHGGTVAPPLATVCSSLKWALIASAIAYALCGAVLWLRASLPRPRRAGA